MKLYKIKCYEEIDEYSDLPYRQWIDDPQKYLNFYVQDLTDCPEDATIWRDLFNINDYIETIKLGIKLGQEGYDDLDIDFHLIKEGECEC